eukprot:jgi/Hompol1/6508/HPOL_005003-RA
MASRPLTTTTTTTTGTTAGTATARSIPTATNGAAPAAGPATPTSTHSHLPSTPASASLHAPTSKPRPPRIISHFQLGKTLGHGTFAKVKLATCLETGRQYACKIVQRPLRDPQAAPNPAILVGPTQSLVRVPGADRPIRTTEMSKMEQEDQRIIREMAMTLLLTHPNIVPLREVIVTQDHYYMFFE